MPRGLSPKRVGKAQRHGGGSGREKVMQPGKARAHVQHLDQNKPRQHKASPPPAEPAHQQKDRNDQRGIAERPDEAFRGAQRIRITQNPLRQLDNREADTGNGDIRRNSKQRHGHQH